MISSEIQVTELRADDKERWTELWRAYLAFYEATLPPEVFESTWQRLQSKSGALRGFGVRESNSTPLLGITHWFLHESAWTSDPVCYLQDLFVDPAERGKGYARRLIEAVAHAAKELGCVECHWLTHEKNSQARLLYDKVAKYRGFIEYEFDYSKTSWESNRWT